MKFLLLGAFAATLAISAGAQAQPPCGDPDPTTNFDTVLPNGQHIQGFEIWSGGLGNNGMAIMNLHRYCGQIKVYLYTGDDPGDDITVWPMLDNNIVAHDVRDAACVATLAKTSDAYYEGYPAERWPLGFRVDRNDQWDSGSNVYVMMEAWNDWGVNLQPWHTYTIEVLCPPNH